MLRLLTVALLFSSSFVSAQTTLDITLQGGGTCSYVTGPVSNGSAPGHLQATATSESGSGCASGGTGSVTFGPASPAVAAPAILPNNTGTSTINFQVLNADTCVGTINPTTGASFVGSPTLCSKTGPTPCSSPVSAVASFDNETTTAVNYGVTVTCNGTAGQAISTTSVQAQGKNQQGSCPAIANSAGGSFTRATTAVLGPYPNPTNQDATSFTKAFGDAGFPNWPGHPGLLQQFMLPTSNYISLQFTVPSTFFTGVNSNSYGSYTVSDSTSGYTAPISMTISTKCGDFSSPTDSGTSVVCRGNLLIGNGLSGITWGNGQQCPLTDNTTYYLNFINANITNVKPNGAGTATTSANSKCTSGKCSDVFTDAPNSWH